MSKAKRLCMSILVVVWSGWTLWGWGIASGNPKLDGLLTLSADEDPGIIKPVLASKVTPKYPEEAIKENVTGEVKIDTSIGIQGEVIDPRVVNEADSRLGQAALEAVRQWKFKPATNKEGKAIRVKVTLTVKFALK